MAPNWLSAIFAVVLLVAPQLCHAFTLKSVSKKTVAPGIEVRHYTTTGPTTKLWAAFVDLCKARVHVDATKAPKAFATAGSWGTKRGAKLVVNGDFYKSGPRVYGHAVGLGVPWPGAQVSFGTKWKSDWYWRNHGWIAFMHDEVKFSHTKHTKKNAAKLGVTKGWSPSVVTDTLPAGVIGLISGFPELVIEGKQVTCSSPTASSCFPDRGDFKARHPRTAMGFSADRRTFIVAVVDGRTSKSKGMYGAELAELMKKLGAWTAFNIDGGGSSQMWVAGSGYQNDVKGNNNGGSVRAVANHWGVMSGASQNLRPGHCHENKPCKVLPPAGGMLDNGEGCFVPFGPTKYWRTEKGGIGGTLRWTAAFSGSTPGNWAWWRLELAQAGKYKVEYHAVAKWAVHKKTRYQVRAAGKTHTVVVDQSKGGPWRAIGTYDFAQGGRQWLSVFDTNGGNVGKDQKIIADAIRLTRVGPWCGNATCDPGETCKSCAKDCGLCPYCGDGQCVGAETCTSCAKDCGACPPKCGDGECAGAETCQSCANDCGDCPTPKDAGGSAANDTGGNPLVDAGIDSGDEWDAALADAPLADVPLADAATDTDADAGADSDDGADGDSDVFDDTRTDTLAARNLDTAGVVGDTSVVELGAGVVSRGSDSGCDANRRSSGPGKSIWFVVACAALLALRRRSRAASIDR